MLRKHLFLLISLLFTLVSYSQSTETAKPEVRIGPPCPENKPIVIIYDGLSINGEKMRELDPNEISSIEVYKSSSSVLDFVEKYGDNAKNGVVVIHSKNETARLILREWGAYNAKCLKASEDASFDYKKWKIIIDKEEIDFPKDVKKEMDDRVVEKVVLRRRFRNSFTCKLTMTTRY